MSVVRFLFGFIRAFVLCRFCGTYEVAARARAPKLTVRSVINYPKSSKMNELREESADCETYGEAQSRFSSKLHFAKLYGHTLPRALLEPAWNV